MLKQVTCALLLGAGLVDATEARVYAGCTLGKSAYEYSDVEDGNARNLFVGYEQNDGPLYLELARIDTGDSDIIGTTYSISVEGTTLAVGFRVANDGGSAVFLKGGIYDTETTIADSVGGSTRDGNTGVFIGVGGDWMLSRNFGLRFDLQGLVGVEDFSEDNTVSFTTVGAVLKFGGPD